MHMIHLCQCFSHYVILMASLVTSWGDKKIGNGGRAMAPHFSVRKTQCSKRVKMILNLQGASPNTWSSCNNRIGQGGDKTERQIGINENATTQSPRPLSLLLRQSTMFDHLYPTQQNYYCLIIAYYYLLYLFLNFHSILIHL